jgi:hypothetical protein
MRFFEYDDEELEEKTMLEEEEEEEEEGDSSSPELLEDEAKPVEDYSEFLDIDEDEDERVSESSGREGY